MWIPFEYLSACLSHGVGRGVVMIIIGHQSACLSVTEVGREGLWTTVEYNTESHCHHSNTLHVRTCIESCTAITLTTACTCSSNVQLKKEMSFMHYLTANLISIFLKTTPSLHGSLHTSYPVSPTALPVEHIHAHTQCRDRRVCYRSPVPNSSLPTATATVWVQWPEQAAAKEGGREREGERGAREGGREGERRKGGESAAIAGGSGFQQESADT